MYRSIRFILALWHTTTNAERYFLRNHFILHFRANHSYRQCFLAYFGVFLFLPPDGSRNLRQGEYFSADFSDDLAILQEYLYNLHEHWKNVPAWPLIVGAILLQFLNFITEFPLRGMSRNVKATLRQYYSNNQWTNGNILPVFIYIVQIVWQYC